MRFLIARAGGAIRVTSIVFGMLLLATVSPKRQAWGGGQCREPGYPPGCGEAQKISNSPIFGGKGQGNNSGRNANPKGSPPPADCGAARQQMAQLCSQYDSESGNLDAQEETRQKIGNLQDQWNRSSCTSGGGLGCGPNGGGGGGGAPAQSASNSSGPSSGGGGGGGSGGGGASTAGGTGSKKGPTGFLMIYSGGVKSSGH